MRAAPCPVDEAVDQAVKWGEGPETGRPGSQDGEHDDGHARRPAKLARAKGRNGARAPSHVGARFPVNVIRNTGFASSPEFNPYRP